MSKTAFLFPGQGSQSVGMGVALAGVFPEASKLYEQASLILEWDLLEVCKNGPEEKLKQTDIAQPALYVAGYAASVVLRSVGIAPDAVAGHSIGEYSALAAAGVFGFTEGLDLVRERGKLMATAGAQRPGGMAAVLGLDREALIKLCASVSSAESVCVPVNYNSPEQIVVAGDKTAVEALVAAAPQSGAKRVIPLNVSGAFHSPLMAEAAARMKANLSRVAFRDASCPVAMNVDGQPRQNGTEIQAALAQQLDHSVEWVRSVEQLKAAGCTIFVECGSGRVLSGLVKRIDRQLELHSTETLEALEETRQALATARKGTVPPARLA